MKIAGEIPRIHQPSAEELERAYIQLGKPVVVTGAINHWPAIDRWSIPYIRERCGDNQVHARTLAPDGGTSYRSMTLRDYLAALEQDADASRSGSVGDVPLGKVLWQIADDVGPSPYRRTPIAKQAVMIGRRTCAPLHFHGATHAISSQLAGTKRFVLFDPQQSASIYPRAWYSPSFYNFSYLDLDTDRTVELARFPAFADVVGLECTLQPGEFLFIPVHWWHAVYGGDAFNVLMVDFFPAPLKQWAFPFPGARSLVHRAVERMVPQRLIDWYLAR